MAKAKKKGTTQIELSPGDGAVIIREDGTYNLLLPDKPLDMALSFKHLLMTGFALGLGNDDKRMHKVLGKILTEAHDSTKKRKKSGKGKKTTASPKARTRRKTES